jgi:hypothetical protein
MGRRKYIPNQSVVENYIRLRQMLGSAGFVSYLTGRMIPEERQTGVSERILRLKTGEKHDTEGQDR